MANCLRNITIRKFSACKSLQTSMSEPLNVKVASSSHQHDNSGALWKKLFFFGCVPSILLAYINFKTGEEEKPPEFKKYSYLRIRNKPFPWGDGQKSLFHNPHTNALPNGYEHH